MRTLAPIIVTTDLGQSARMLSLSAHFHSAWVYLADGAPRLKKNRRTDDVQEQQ